MQSHVTRRHFLRMSSLAIGGAYAWIGQSLPLAAGSRAQSIDSLDEVLRRAEEIEQLVDSPWTRKHDLPGTPLIPSAEKILYPNSLEQLIQICADRETNEYLKAAGSHWALSEAAISDSVFIETHDPNNAFPAMGRTLYDVVPYCLTDEYLDLLGSQSPEPFDQDHAEPTGTYLVHVESGKRVYQLYSELDLGDDNNVDSLARYIEQEYGNPNYRGPWALATLGGAAGQTIFGAITTGTHGGDHDRPPMADSVMAMHLVADGGKHYWIEPTPESGMQLTDDAALTALYGGAQYGGANGAGNNFEIIRDDDIFNAVLVSAGRFGIVYSIVVRVVRQYSLHEERRLSTWQEVKTLIKDPSSELYSARFLQIAISVTPHGDFQQNLCGVTKRWNVPMAINPATNAPIGRDERRGKVVEAYDSEIQGPRFEYAGNSFPFSPDPENPNLALPPNFLERACSNSDFLVGVIESVVEEIRQYIFDNKAVRDGVLFAVATIGPAALQVIFEPLGALFLALLPFLAFLRGSVGPRLGGSLDALRKILLHDSDPNTRSAGLLLWQSIFLKQFEDQQKDYDYEAISYVVMDGHNYFDKSCTVNTDSVEVFFDATQSDLIAFVDALIAFEIAQEHQGKAFVGYASLRFTQNTRALIGMQQWPLTCAVEVAGLKDVEGTQELIDYAVALSRDKNYECAVHWGQRNDSVVSDIEHRFGESLTTWREALARITDNGRFYRFSSAFTRRTGLEICKAPLDSQFPNPCPDIPAL